MRTTYATRGGFNLTAVRNELGLPSQGRAWLKMLVQGVKLGADSLNVGMMNGKNGEIKEMMGGRKIEVVCVQETRWKGNKTRELGGEYKLFYSGVIGQGRNGVGCRNRAIK